MAEKENKKLTLEEKIILISNKIRVTKDGENTYSNYSYFTPDGILTTLNPLFLEYGVFSHFTLERIDNYYRGILKLFDAQDRNYFVEYSMTSPEIVIKATNPVQSLGGLQTYLKRYLLMNAFHIADNKDDFDSNEQHEKKNNIQPKAKTEPKEIKETNTNGSQFYIELKNKIRETLGGKMNVKEAIEQLNKLTKNKFDKFPTDEEVCKALLFIIQDLEVKNNGN